MTEEKAGYSLCVEKMNAEKASTLKLLREGIGNTVHVLESTCGDAVHELRAHLPDRCGSSAIPVLFLLSSLAFLEAAAGIPADEASDSSDFHEADGWTPADFLSHLKFEGKELRLSLTEVRGRAVFTDLSLTHSGDLKIRTLGRGQSATRWLSFVQGRRHLQEI
jgi:hypothetical protein